MATTVARWVRPAVSADYRAPSASRRAGIALAVIGLARALWAPMLVMGAMAVVIGLVLSFAQAGNALSNPRLAGSQGA